MGKLCWITDPHMNFVSDREWFRRLLDEETDGFLITGDIAESKSVVGCLSALAEETTKPIYFVLGNHDFYKGSVAKTRGAVAERCSNPKGSLHYLHDISYAELSEKTSLIGVDGWYDGRAGDFHNSSVALNDFRMIDELYKPLRDGDGMEALLHAMQNLTDQSARMLREKVDAAISPKTERLLIATHVPPFPGAAWHKGQVSDSDHLPFFSNVAVGIAILEATAAFREDVGGKVDVYCGHTHSPGVIFPAENLTIHTGGAEYYNPGKVGDIFYE